MYNSELDKYLCEFKRVVGDDGIIYKDYYINKQGVIINCKRRTMRVMSPKISNWGYYTISLRDDEGVRREYSLHKLVAKTFISNPRGNKKQVNHIDGNKLNNSVDNLEWCNQSENTQHAYDTGLIKNVMKKYELYYNNEFIKTFQKQKDMTEYLQAQTSLSFDHIRKCISGERPITKKSTLYGYEFKEV